MSLFLLSLIEVCLLTWNILLKHLQLRKILSHNKCFVADALVANNQAEGATSPNRPRHFSNQSPPSSCHPPANSPAELRPHFEWNLVTGGLLAAMNFLPEKHRFSAWNQALKRTSGFSAVSSASMQSAVTHTPVGPVFWHSTGELRTAACPLTVTKSLGEILKQADYASWDLLGCGCPTFK